MDLNSDRESGECDRPKEGQLAAEPSNKWNIGNVKYAAAPFIPSSSRKFACDGGSVCVCPLHTYASDFHFQ